METQQQYGIMLRERIKMYGERYLKKKAILLPQLEAHVKREEQERDNVQPGPLALRRRRHHDRLILWLNQYITDLREDIELRMFHKKSSQYLHALDTMEDASTVRDLLQDYMVQCEGSPAPVHIFAGEVCHFCQNSDRDTMLLSTDGSRITCRQCGRGYPYLDATTAVVAYGDEVEFNVTLDRKLLDYLEWLTKFMNQETSVVSQQILEKVHKNIVSTTNKEDATHITHRDVFDALLCMKLQKFYPYVSQIARRITGKPPPHLSPEEQTRLQLLFKAIHASLDILQKAMKQPKRLLPTQQQQQQQPNDTTTRQKRGRQKKKKDNIISTSSSASSVVVNARLIAETLFRVIGRSDLIDCMCPLTKLERKTRLRFLLDQVLRSRGYEMPPEAYLQCSDLPPGFDATCPYDWLQRHYPQWVVRPP
jgi:hypothetical protein